MIAFLPSFYPHELFYSMIARYHVRTGRSDVGLDIDSFYFSKHDVPPDFEFVGKLRDGILPFLLDHLSFVDRNESVAYAQSEDRLRFLINHHTLFPYYARFMPADRRRDAYDALCQMDTYRMYRLLPIPQRRKERYARYCPLCAAEARERFGEAYWSTQHNLFGVNVCPVHGCRLHEASELRIVPRMRAGLLPAEDIIPNREEPVICDNKTEIRLAQYVAEVFRSPLSFENDTPIGKYLQSRLEPRYVTPRGQRRHMDRLQADFGGMYNGIDLDDFGNIIQLTHIFEGKRISPNEICALSMMLGITPDELSAPVLPSIDRTEAIDRSIRDLREKGYTFKRISEELGLPIYTCKDVGSDRCRRR